MRTSTKSATGSWRLALAAFLMMGAVLSAASVQADTVVLPGAFAAVDGTSSDATGLGVAANRGQVVYGNTLLGDLDVGDVITGITFRVDGTLSAVGAQTVPNYEIRLSQSQNVPGSLSMTFATNRGADEVIVRSGPLTIAAGDFPGGSSPNSFGAVITFTTPYTFQGGPLLLEYSHDPFPAGGRSADATVIAGAQSIYGNSFSATTANIGSFNNYAPMIQLTTLVPEPASAGVALLAAGVGMLGMRRPRAKWPMGLAHSY